MAKKIGRPRLGKRPLEARIDVRLESAEKAELDRLAAREGVSSGHLARTYIRAGLRLQRRRKKKRSS